MRDEKRMLQPAFQYFGGKRKVIEIVWERFGDVGNYIEPFAGSLAVLMRRPHWPWTGHRIETVNDLDGFVSNFWRAAKADPEGLAELVDYPVNEVDLLARHRWLVEKAGPRLERLKTDPEFYDLKAAAWWVWGICQWIGGGWCQHLGSMKLPHVGGPGMGVHRPGMQNRESLLSYFHALSRRLRGVRVACGDWSRVLGPSTISIASANGIFMDPPYLHTTSDGKVRTKGTYAHDSEDVADRAREWCLEHGDDPTLRIALCGYEGEHPMPATWTCVPWKATGGYGNQGKGKGRENAGRERIWFSPHCLTSAADSRLGLAPTSHQRLHRPARLRTDR